MEKGKLYLVGLHIGNKDDISFRTIQYLKQAKNIVIEREEAFKQSWPDLFNNKERYTNIISIEFVGKNGQTIEEKERTRVDEIINLLNSGEDVYMVSDEGMPAAADPGIRTINAAIHNKIDIIATPGPSVIIAAAAVTGVIHNFSFESFMPPDKKSRMEWIKERKNNINPMIMVLRNMSGDLINGELQFSNEIPEFLDEAIEILGPDRRAALCYNLTRNNEFVVRDTLINLKSWFLNRKRSDRDLITIVVDTHRSRMSI